MVARLRFGLLQPSEPEQLAHAVGPVTSPNYVLHATAQEWRPGRTLCGSRIDRRWMPGEVLVKSVCSTCSTMQATRYV